MIADRRTDKKHNRKDRNAHGSVPSIASMSFPNLLSILPTGFESKNTIGRCSTFETRFACSRNAPFRQAIPSEQPPITINIPVLGMWRIIIWCESRLVRNMVSIELFNQLRQEYGSITINIPVLVMSRIIILIESRLVRNMVSIELLSQLETWFQLSYLIRYVRNMVSIELSNQLLLSDSKAAKKISV